MTNVQTVFQNVNGASFVGIDTLTQVKLAGGKANPQQGRITKQHTGAQVMVFQNRNSNGYENMIQRRLQQEGKDPASFVLGERAWGVRLQNSPFIRHEKDGEAQYYVEFIYLRAGTVQYLQDGQPINKEDIVGLKETEVDEEAQGGVSNKVIIRSFKLDSITTIRIDGTAYVGPFTY